MTSLYPIVSSSLSPCPTTPRAHAPAAPAGPCDSVSATSVSPPRAAVNPRAHALSPPTPSNGAAASSSTMPAAPSPAATLLERLPLESFAQALVRDLRLGLARYGVDGDEQLMEDGIDSQASEDSSDEGSGETWPRLSELQGNIQQDLQRAQVTPPPRLQPLHALMAELDNQEGAQAAAIAYKQGVAIADQKLDSLVASMMFCGVRLSDHPQSAPLSVAEEQAAHRLLEVLHASRPVLADLPLNHSLHIQGGSTLPAMMAQVAMRGMLSLQNELLNAAEIRHLEQFYQSAEAEFILQVKEAFGAWTLAACESSAAPWLKMLDGIAMSRAGDQMLGLENAQGILQCGRVFAAPGAAADAPVVPFVR